MVVVVVLAGPSSPSNTPTHRAGGERERERPPRIHHQFTRPRVRASPSSPDLDDHDHDHDHDDHDHDDHDDQQRHNEVGQGPLAGVGTFASPPNSAPRSIDLFESPYCTVLYLCLPKSSASSWIFWQTIQTRCVSVRSCRVTFWLLLVVCFFAMFFSCLWLVSLHPVPPRL